MKIKKELAKKMEITCCKFCGSDDEINLNGDGYMYRHISISCGKRKADGPESDTVSGAIEKWNVKTNE